VGDFEIFPLREVFDSTNQDEVILRILQEGKIHEPGYDYLFTSLK
jgi:hypothetical protein